MWCYVIRNTAYQKKIPHNSKSHNRVFCCVSFIFFVCRFFFYLVLFGEFFSTLFAISIKMRFSAEMHAQMLRKVNEEMAPRRKKNNRMHQVNRDLHKYHAQIHRNRRHNSTLPLQKSIVRLAGFSLSSFWNEQHFKSLILFIWSIFPTKMEYYRNSISFGSVNSNVITPVELCWLLCIQFTVFNGIVSIILREGINSLMITLETLQISISLTLIFPYYFV